MKKGDIIKANDFVLRVVDMRWSWVKCEYYDEITQTWKQRGITENRARLEEGIERGIYKIITEAV